MKTVFYGLMSAILMLAGASTAEAQVFPAPYYVMGSNNYGHASTVEEGAARGLADVIRSSGAANLMNSEAAINVEEARRKYIENRLQATQTYFDMQRVNRQARAEKRPQPASQQQLIRFAQERLPQRLTASQLDPLTGALNWPTILRSAAFSADRQKLEQLFTKRASESYLSPDEFLEVQDIVFGMQQELRRVGTSFPGSMQIEARQFLESLNFEARFQA